MTCAMRQDSLFEPATFGDALAKARSRTRLSQLELAVRAGTTQRHVSFLERGRSVPGRGLVIRLAEALELSLRERNALLLRAGYAPVYEEMSRSPSCALRPSFLRTPILRRASSRCERCGNLDGAADGP